MWKTDQRPWICRHLHRLWGHPYTRILGAFIPLCYDQGSQNLLQHSLFHLSLGCSPAEQSCLHWYGSWGVGFICHVIISTGVAVRTVCIPPPAFCTFYCVPVFPPDSFALHSTGISTAGSISSITARLMCTSTVPVGTLDLSPRDCSLAPRVYHSLLVWLLCRCQESVHIGFGKDSPKSFRSQINEYLQPALSPSFFESLTRFASS